MSALLGALIIHLSMVALSSANIQDISAAFIRGKTVATSHTSLQKYSKAQCVKKCFEEGKKGACSVAGYNKATKVCYLSTDTEADVLDVADELSGVFVVSQPSQGIYNIYNSAFPVCDRRQKYMFKEKNSRLATFKGTMTK